MKYRNALRLISAATLTGCFYPEMIELPQDAGAPQTQNGGAPHTSFTVTRPTGGIQGTGDTSASAGGAILGAGGSISSSNANSSSQSGGATQAQSGGAPHTAVTVTQPTGGAQGIGGTSANVGGATLSAEGGISSSNANSSPQSGGATPDTGSGATSMGGTQQDTGGSEQALGGITQGVGGTEPVAVTSAPMAGGAAAVAGGSAAGGTSPAPSSSSCGSKDCFSTDDNDCNGKADNLEQDCIHCIESSPRRCDPHPGCDNLGLCHAGSQTLNIASDHQKCEWSKCSESQGPTEFEACGPTKPDANCNGIVGDGTNSGCVGTVYIFEGPAQAGSCGGPTGYAGGTIATISRTAPHSGWSEIAHFNLFTTNEENTAAVRMCQVSDISYVTIGDDCATLTDAYNGPYFTPTDLGIIGYVATSAGAGYLPLDQFTQTLTSYPSSLVPIANVPVAHEKCPSGRSCSVSTFYTLPDVISTPACL